MTLINSWKCSAEASMENTVIEDKTIIHFGNTTCTIYLGDSRKILSSFKNSVNLIVTSPPYADARRNHYDSVLPDKYKDWFLTFNDVFYSCLLPNGSFVLNIKDKVVNGVRHRYVWDTIQALSTLGWYFNR